MTPTKSKRDNEERANVYVRIARKNAELRARYLRTTKLCTAEDIRELNPSASSSEWKREGRVFAVQRDGEDLFPAFQFADGEPLPIIQKILKVLPEDLTPWQTAFWFQSPNGWLDGKIPQECLKNESKVIYAAEQLGNLVIG